jgi:predicted permease
MTAAELWRRVSFLIRGSRATRDLEEEVQLHLALRAARFRERGMEKRDATAAAHRRFGNTLRVVEQSREAWIARRLDALRLDVRYALRGLRRSPTFTLVAIVTLALGLGLNAAIYSLLDRLFIQRPALVASPDALRRLYLTESYPTGTFTRDQFNYPEAAELIAASARAALAATTYGADTVLVGTDARFASAAFVDSAYWRVLGVEPAIGRSLTGGEARIETVADVAVVSDAFARRALGSARAALGRRIRINDRLVTIVGVAPRGFSGPDLDVVDLWLPLGAMPMDKFGPDRLWYRVRSSPKLRLIVRGAPSALPGLDGRMTAAARAGLAAEGEDRGRQAPSIVSGPIIEALGPLAPSQERLVATRLAWVSLLVLLVACASVANLMLTRVTERRREFAVRLSLGASRSRVAAQLVVESVTIGAASLCVALVVGAWAGALLRRMLMPSTHWGSSAGVLEPWLIAAVAAAALLLAIGVGLAPVVQLRHFRGAEALKDGARATPQAARLRGALVVAQTALAVVLVCGAALFVQSLRHVQQVDLGYDVDRILLAEPELLGERGGADWSRNPLLRTALVEAAARIAAVPGVAGVALASHGPMAGYYAQSVRVPGRDSSLTLDGMPAGMHEVSPEYWSVVGIRAAAGRLTTASDAAGASLIVVVNETMARAIWPGRSAIGQCVVIYGPGSGCRTVIGVVRDAHLISIVEKPRMTLYVPLAQATPLGAAARPSAIIVRASPGRAAVVEASMRRILAQLLPASRLGLVEMHEVLTPQLRPWQLGAALFSLLGLLALVIASVGLYGVIAYGVRARTRELGIRLALGARRGQMAGRVVATAMRAVSIGVAGGAVISLVLVRFAGSLLYDTSLRDPSVLSAVGGVMLSTAMVASIVPAWRAARVDPVIALRSE